MKDRYVKKIPEEQLSEKIHHKLVAFLHGRVAAILAYLPTDAALSTLNDLLTILNKSPKTVDAQVRRDEELKNFNQKYDLVNVSKPATTALSMVPFMFKKRPKSVIKTTVAIALP